jgi:hypothetical protein
VRTATLTQGELHTASKAGVAVRQWIRQHDDTIVLAWLEKSCDVEQAKTLLSWMRCTTDEKLNEWLTEHFRQMRLENKFLSDSLNSLAC